MVYCGFNLDYIERNKKILEKGEMKKMVEMKTGTTICGLVFKEGVIIAGDTRSTSGYMIANRNCEKLHKLMDNIYCAGAGTAADTENITKIARCHLILHNYGVDNGPTKVVAAKTILSAKLFKYQGYIQAYLILGGVDNSGIHLHTLHAHGSTSTVPYCSMGSGSLAALSVLETSFIQDMNEQTAIELAKNAIMAGIKNDLMSGSNVDMVVIKRGKTTFFRNMVLTNNKNSSLDIKYRIPVIPDDTIIKKTTVHKFEDQHSTFIQMIHAIREFNLNSKKDENHDQKTGTDDNISKQLENI